MTPSPPVACPPGVQLRPRSPSWNLLEEESRSPARRTGPLLQKRAGHRITSFYRTRRKGVEDLPDRPAAGPARVVWGQLGAALLLVQTTDWSIWCRLRINGCRVNLIVPDEALSRTTPGVSPTIPLHRLPPATVARTSSVYDWAQVDMSETRPETPGGDRRQTTGSILVLASIFYTVIT
ncbi:hypothetical protein N7510_003003 [Penicillium lagena]|uniref:uncharacterized protein n=1 Tax=Penicillium lagena TaxID=94218 RepID=UPI002540679F|nr:uncharacterized protein N7510_003003 [Penicillium lagena]KAJ5619019.1 hypothetical protein N7510_003003 [Penicillium lagena]